MRGIVMRLAGLVGLVTVTESPSQAVWQADLSIRGLTVSESPGRLTVRVVLGADLGEAMAARVEVLLPVGVGIVEVSPGCAPGPAPPGMTALRARVVCSLGDLPPRSSREVQVSTTVPPAGIAAGFGAMALSDTPDPRPANNFAERTLTANH